MNFLLKLLQPQPLPFDLKEWRTKSFNERTKMLCEAWCIQGYGAPGSVYVFYILKIILYVCGWVFFCSFSEQLGGWSTISEWWYKGEALGRFIVWSVLFECLGLGCGSGPLTARYFPPFGGVLHFARPGTIRLPAFPNLPFFKGDSRRWIDVALYLLFVCSLLWVLCSSAIHPSAVLLPVLLLPVLGLIDKTIFLSARAEHYWIAMICLLFPLDTIAAWKWVWLAIWWGAATSKLNRHFPAVVAVMVSNHALLRWQWLRKKLYVDYPNDLRASRFTTVLAHFGTVVEYTFPILLIWGGGGPLTQVALVIMLVFHLYITSSIPMGVPLEWNVIMVFGAFVLFGMHGEVAMMSVSALPLVIVLEVSLLFVPIWGNFFPEQVSFLNSMRYYAGNWAYSVWLFKGDSDERLDEQITKAASTVNKQLGMFYDEETSFVLTSKVTAFRMMHLHGRALQQLIPLAVDDVEDYRWRDGELVAGLVLGWNFGDGHLHDEQLLSAIQKRCDYEAGELRCIFVESQPMLRPIMEYRIVDAKDGELTSGIVKIDDLMALQPYPQ